MNLSNITKKIRLFSLISFIIPLITLNSCLAIYKILGNYYLYTPLNWDQIEIGIKFETTLDEYKNLHKKLNHKRTFTNCPKYNYTEYFVSKDGRSIGERTPDDTVIVNELLRSKQIKSIIIKKEEGINNFCIKSNIFFYSLLSKFSYLERILIETKKFPGEGGQNWQRVKNPYLYGEVSISRTARYYPANLIFKPFIILTAFFLFFYWSYNLKLFNVIKKLNPTLNFSKKFFYFGVFSCLFLIMHAILLGTEFDIKIFDIIRRLVLFLFIIFELFAQSSLTINIYKKKDLLINYINPLFLKIKVAFISLFFISTIIIFSGLFLGYLNDAKHIIEWNYFTILLLYYLLSRFVWKIRKP
jgi:hypothetical protein